MIGLNIKQKKIALFIFVALIILWSIFIFSIDIEIIIDSIGVENVYLILFIIAATTGTSFLTSAAFYAVFLSYVSAGFDPVLLGIVGGIGMSIGDSLFFYFSRKAGDVMHATKNRWYKKAYKFVSKLSRSGVYIFTYLYISFAPTPNDILMIILGALKFKPRYIIPIVVLGNITLLTLIAYGINFTFL